MQIVERQLAVTASFVFHKSVHSIAECFFVMILLRHEEY